MIYSFCFLLCALWRAPDGVLLGAYSKKEGALRGSPIGAVDARHFEVVSGGRRGERTSMRGLQVVRTNDPLSKNGQSNRTKTLAGFGGLRENGTDYAKKLVMFTAVVLRGEAPDQRRGREEWENSTYHYKMMDELRMGKEKKKSKRSS